MPEYVCLYCGHPAEMWIKMYDHYKIEHPDRPVPPAVRPGVTEDSTHPPLIG